MNRPVGVQADLYEQVLEHARREIDEASGKIEELRRTLQLLDARVEAAKSVYEAVAARLNLEDELEEESEAYPVSPPPEQAPEPPEEPAAEAAPDLAPPTQSEAPDPPAEPIESAGPEKSGNGSGGFNM